MGILFYYVMPLTKRKFSHNLQFSYSYFTASCIALNAIGLENQEGIMFKAKTIDESASFNINQ